MAENPLRSPDPINPFSPQRIVNETNDGTRHPNRFEPRTATIPNTNMVRNDAVRVYRTAALSVTSLDTLSFDTSSYDVTGMWNGSTGFVIPASGKVTGIWMIQAQVAWPGTGAGGLRQIELRKNGTMISAKAGPANTISQAINDTINDPSRGDVFTVTVTHDAGGALALTVGSYNVFFSMIHIG